MLQKSPSALGTLGEDRLKSLLRGYPEPVQERSKPLFQQLQNAQRERIERLEKLEPLLTAGGDVGRGRRLFFGEKVACSSCHTIGTEGREVGPDLTGIGAIRSGHDLLEAIVFPSASFVPGHEVFNVDTENERLSGVIKSQSREAVVLITGPDGEVRIPRGLVKAVTPSKVSLMPEGFDDQLTRSELTDLLAFLRQRRRGREHEDIRSRRDFLGLALAAVTHAADLDDVIDIHQHTNYSGRTDEQLIAHQRTMGIAKSVLLPAGSKYGLAASAGGNATVLAIARAYPKEYVFFANELPDIPETKSVIEKYLKAGAIGIGEQKFNVDCDSRHMQLIAEIARDHKFRSDAFSARHL